jgi:hypothetical protein
MLATAEKPVKFKRWDPSFFYKLIRSLVSDTEINLEVEEPIFNADLWRERKEQIVQLKTALNNVLADPFRDDRPLFVECEMILRHCHTAWFSDYNDFKVDLKDILSKIKPEQMNLPTQQEREAYYQSIYSKAEGRRNESRIISEAKSALSKELTAPAALKIIETKLAEIKIDGVSGDEILKRLVKLTEQKVVDKVSTVIEEIQNILQEQQIKSKTMEFAFKSLLNELKEIYGLLEAFKKAHPKEFAQLCARIAISTPILEKFNAAKSTGQLIVGRGLLRRGDSAGSLYEVPDWNQDLASPTAKPPH